ncbi:coiled-coil domain-containing protein R3HCC1L isoform X2 [Plutella xylostella]|uniref:coiled-coil domain-containing protein R3HCC1L isoform X2 n=1 Tax=Plutella xylostella TaxID=51655 RepID=UPI002032ADF4|nr:coiled-coil domain-containing protein R3HCC1L isoform X2 [Plutella xylostella]
MSALTDCDFDTESGSARPRRPDRAVYVPRALRASDTAAGDTAAADTAAGDPADDPPPADTRKRQTSVTPTVKPPKSPRDKSLPGTPRKSIDKAFCNVYTPPHLRSQRSHTEPSICDQTEYVPSVPNSDSAIEFSDNNCNEIGNNFYIGDYFANGQLGLYNPNYYYSDIEKYSDLNGSLGDPNESNELNMAVPDANTNIIDNGYGLHYNKDEDVEANELRRASREINRSSKRIIKQSFDSDVLVISDPVEDNKAVNDETQKETNVTDEETSPVKPKQKLEPRLSLKREENDWDAVFDDSGECLDPSLLEELTATVGKVHISKAKNNYDQYQTRGQALFSGPVDESFAHVVEVYDFPSEFKTNDLLSVFSEYKDTGFEIKWVDDTHALIVFSSAKIAAEVLSAQKPLVRCRPLHAATAESRGKAKKCAEFLQPYRQRPETCTALARRLVSGALGVKLSTARQERAEERRLITIAREKKRQAALHKEAAWDGSLGQPLGDT